MGIELKEVEEHAVHINIYYNQYNNENITNHIQMNNAVIYGNIADGQRGAVYMYNYNRCGNQHFQLKMYNTNINFIETELFKEGQYTYHRYGQNFEFQLEIHNTCNCL